MAMRAVVCAQAPTERASKLGRGRGAAKRNVASRAATAAPSKLDQEVARDVLDKTEAFVLDCDGVVWRGDEVIEGVPEVLDMLKGMGKRAVFVTNNSTKSRKGYLKKFHQLGLTQVNEDDIFSSSFAAAGYLRSQGFGPEDPARRSAYVIGEAGVMEELDYSGIPAIGGPDHAGVEPPTGPGGKVEVDESVGAVVVGLDKSINYYKLQYATVCIRELGAEFVATNTDAVTHITDAQEWAGNGALVGAVQGSTEVEPMVVGKPNAFMLEHIAQQLGLRMDQLCMVGDRLDTDVLFGQRNGLRTVLSLSGVTPYETLEKSTVQPDSYCASLADLLSVKA